MENLYDYNQFIGKKINENVDVQTDNTPITDFLPQIDYTELGKGLPKEHMIEICDKANKLGVATVCVQPENVALCAEALSNSEVGVCTVLSFPEGTNSKEEKIAECKQVINDSCDEIDTVLNWRELKNLGEEYFEIGKEEIEALAELCHGHDKILKVIVESSELNEEQTVIATQICLAAGADFIKTSTGFAPNGIGAELDKIKIMFETIQESNGDMLIKASGGIRDINKIRILSPYVDRYGVGYKAVDTMAEGGVSTSAY